MKEDLPADAKSRDKFLFQCIAVAEGVSPDMHSTEVCLHLNLWLPHTRLPAFPRSGPRPRKPPRSSPRRKCDAISYPQIGRVPQKQLCQLALDVKTHNGAARLVLTHGHWAELANTVVVKSSSERSFPYGLTRVCAPLRSITFTLS